MEPGQLRELLTKHDVSQEELAEVIGTKQPNIARLLARDKPLTAKMTTRIYEGLEWYLAEPEPGEREAWLTRMRTIIDEMPKDP